LLEEPQFTLSTTNTIYWQPVYDANDYYIECANDPNFLSIVAVSGWINDTSYEFNDLQLGKTFFYRVKASGVSWIDVFDPCSGTFYPYKRTYQSVFSNIESSTQTTLLDAVNTLLDANSFKDPNQKDSFLEKIEAVEAMIEQGHYHPALKKLYNDILKKTDGCENQGNPDKNDWLITCEAQNQIYPLIMETIDYVMYQMGPYDLISFSSFAEYWQNTNCTTSNDCDGTDLDFSGSVDVADLKIFCNYWLIDPN